MKTVVFEVATPDKVMARVQAVLRLASQRAMRTCRFPFDRVKVQFELSAAA